jgi:HK97 family phage major capsid protein
VRIPKTLQQFDQLLLAIALAQGTKQTIKLDQVLQIKNADPVVRMAARADQKMQRDPGTALQLKATIAAGTTTDGGYASPLLAFGSLANAFFESLTSISLLDAILDRCRRISPGTQIEITSAVGAGYSVGETVWSPLSKFQFANDHLLTLKAEALIVITNELLRFMSGDLLRVELSKAAALAADSVILPLLLNGLTLIESTGVPRDDLRELAAAVPIRQTSSLLWMTSPAVVAQLALAGEGFGAPAFPDVALPNGGSIAGVPLLGLDILSDYSTDGDLMLLVDASQIAGDAGNVVLDASGQANIQMTDATGATGPENTVSLFQTGSTAIMADRQFALKKMRTHAVACISHVSYAATSP